MKKILILLSVLIYQISFTQEILVKGGIIDNYELPFPGSQVINLRTNEKVTTDFDGNYQIKAQIGDTLLFKAYEKVVECYTEARRLVYNKENIDVKLWEIKILDLRDCDAKPKELLVFVGKINYMESVFDNSPCADFRNDHGIGEYENIQPIYGDFSNEKKSIKFEASEHAYIDSFIINKHKYALLFIRKYCDDKYYLIFHRDIYRTKNNKWAIKYYNPKRPWYFNGMDSIESKISSIKFKNATVRAKNIDSTKKYLKAPYYKQKGKKFIPLKGFYVEDYFKLWKSNQKEWKYDN